MSRFPIVRFLILSFSCYIFENDTWENDALLCMFHPTLCNYLEWDRNELSIISNQMGSAPLSLSLSKTLESERADSDREPVRLCSSSSTASGLDGVRWYGRTGWCDGSLLQRRWMVALIYLCQLKTLSLSGLCVEMGGRLGLRRDKTVIGGPWSQVG